MDDVQCSQCPNVAIFAVGPQNQIPFCLNCYAKLSDVLDRQNEAHERNINYLTAEMESIVGLPQSLPRYPERRPRPAYQHVGDITLHNIKVDNSIVGTINTGTVQTLDSAVSVLRNQGDVDASQAILGLTQAILGSKDIDAATRKDALDILGAIATQAASPKEQQKPAVVKPLIERVSTLLGQVNDLAGKVKDFIPILTGFFG